MKYGNRSLWKRILASPLTTCAIGILLIVLIRGSWNLYQKTKLSETRLAQARIELEALKQRQSDVAQKVERLSTDEGIEAEIRTKFHAVKAGESVAVIIDESQMANAKSSQENSQATTTAGWWKRMLHMFGIGR
jgi:cell division protein FtsB